MNHHTKFRARVRAEQAANGGNLEEALIAVLADALEDARPKEPKAKPKAAESEKVEEKPAEPKATAPKADKKSAKRKPGRPRKGA